MTKRLSFWLAVYAIACLISSCSTIPQPPAETTATPTISWAERKLALSKITAWNISGKIAVKTPNESGSAFVKWQEQHPRYTIWLTGPLGAGAMQLSGQPGKIVLQANGKTYTAPSTTQLLVQQTGWRLPVENLYYWIRGLPAPGSIQTAEFDAQNRLTTLSQQGWRIQYLAYHSTGHIDLPGLLSLDKGDFHAKIVIKHWGLII